MPQVGKMTRVIVFTSGQISAMIVSWMLNTALNPSGESQAISSIFLVVHLALNIGQSLAFRRWAYTIWTLLSIIVTAWLFGGNTNVVKFWTNALGIGPMLFTMAAALSILEVPMNGNGK